MSSPSASPGNPPPSTSCCSSGGASAERSLRDGRSASRDNLCPAASEQEQAIHPLLPALRSVWLQFHVVAAAIGYGACGVAAALAAAELTRLGNDSQCIAHQTLRVIGWGFPWLTLALLTGAIWAQDAWGRYWGWDPKETCDLDHLAMVPALAAQP